MKVIVARVDRCTGCRTCELYCATERGSEGKTLLQAVQETPVPQPRLRVEGGPDASLPVQCRHCLEAPCLDACLTGALVREEAHGMVHVDEDRCIACWTCVMFCPYGVIFPWPDRKFALKCDRCMHMETSACVDVCPTRALEVVDLAELDGVSAEKRKAAAALAIAVTDGKGAVHLDLAD